MPITTLRANNCENQADIKKPSQWFVFIYVRDCHERKPATTKN